MSFKASMAGFLARLCKADRKMAENLQNPLRNTGALDMERFTKKVRVKNWDIRGFKGVTVNGSYPGRGHILMLPGARIPWNRGSTTGESQSALRFSTT